MVGGRGKGCFGGMVSNSMFFFSRMRSEGFSFNFGSLRVELCSPVVVFVFATVRNRPQPFATVRNRPQVFESGSYGPAVGESSKT